MSVDHDIGRNVARLRAGLSQQSLADKMRERGWKWSQATVWAVEKGDRPLRFAEAVDLARVLGKSLGELVQDEAAAAFHEGLRQWFQAEKTLEDAIVKYESARRVLATVVLDLPHGIHLDAFDKMIQRGPEDFAERMRKDDEQLPPGKRRMLSAETAASYAAEWRERDG